MRVREHEVGAEQRRAERRVVESRSRSRGRVVVVVVRRATLLLQAVWFRVYGGRRG